MDFNHNPLHLHYVPTGEKIVPKWFETNSNPSQLYISISNYWESSWAYLSHNAHSTPKNKTLLLSNIKIDKYRKDILLNVNKEFFQFLDEIKNKVYFQNGANLYLPKWQNFMNQKIENKISLYFIANTKTFDVSQTFSPSSQINKKYLKNRGSKDDTWID